MELEAQAVSPADAGMDTAANNTSATIAFMVMTFNGPLQTRRRVSADVGWKRLLAALAAVIANQFITGTFGL